MTRLGINNLDRIKISGANGTTFYGGNQDWYGKVWRRMAGCGPTTSSNLIMYQERSLLCDDESASCSKESFLGLMDEVWEYVPPTTHGVNKTSILYKGLTKYLASKGLNYTHRVLDVPEDISVRKDFCEVISFLKSALKADIPVAFLNLHNGLEKRLDRWHWVTLIGLDANEAYAEILDNNIRTQIDLSLWYKTTTLGGGFVYVIKDDKD